MTDPAAAPSTRAARVLVQALARLGVRDVVLSPGSRSAPLAYALAAAALPDGERPDGAPAVSLHVRVDERAAAFLALGLARGADALGDDGQAGPRPVAVVTTSGTATANLHPAVLEAHHTGVPLVLLTADRPHELRGTGANQTTDQVGLYGGAVRFAADVPAPSGRAGEDRDLRHLVARAVAAARGARTGDPGPVHLDLAYREPLAPGPDDEAWPHPVDDGLVSVLVRGAGGPGTVGTLPAGAASHLAASAAAPLVAAPDDGTAADDVVPTVVVAGDGAGPVARRIAEVNGWPLLAEPSSGALGGPHGIPAYRLLLGAAALGGAVRRAVVLGRPTLSRPVQALLARDDVEVLVVAPRGATWPDAARRASAVLADVPPRLVGEQDGVPVTPVSRPGEWLERWRSAGAAASSAVDRVLDAAPRGRRSRSGPRLSGPQVARLVAAACRPADVLVVGSSNPVRDLDLVGTWTDGAPVVLANRGLAGIDGTVSTALGVALAAREVEGTGHVRALLGDLTFLHDVGGLLQGPLEPRADLQVVVANDDGGSIFATLEHGAPEHADVFERVFATPHGADLAALCAGYGVRHALARDAGELAAALAAPGAGVSVVEVPVDRARRRELQEQIGAAVAGAVAEALAGDPGGPAIR